MVFENIPYTNFHDLNLDWIVSEMKDFKAKQEGIEGEITEGIETLQETTTEGTTEINDAVNEAISRLEHVVSNYTRRIILLGDSYFTRRNAANHTIPEITRELIGFSSVNCYDAEIAGGAFAHGEVDHRFITLLQNLYPDVSNPDTISEIYVCCGANDANYSYDQNLTAVHEFATYAKTNFPKALIYIIPWGVTFNSTQMFYKDTRAMSAFYRASEYGVYVVQNGKYLLYNSNFMESDRCHPNMQYGVDVLARGLASIIRTGSCESHYQYTLEELGTTVTVDNLKSPLILASYDIANGRMARDNENVILSQINNISFIALIFNINGATITYDNVIHIKLNNTVAAGRIIEVGSSKSPSFNVFLVDGMAAATPAVASGAIEYNSDEQKYEMVIRTTAPFTLNSDSNVLFVMLSSTYTD